MFDAIKRGTNSTIDAFMQRIISRKLTVWLFASYLMWVEQGLSSEDWTLISVIYIGTQAAQDIVATWKGTA